MNVCHDCVNNDQHVTRGEPVTVAVGNSTNQANHCDSQYMLALRVQNQADHAS